MMNRDKNAIGADREAAGKREAVWKPREVSKMREESIRPVIQRKGFCPWGGQRLHSRRPYQGKEVIIGLQAGRSWHIKIGVATVGSASHTVDVGVTVQLSGITFTRRDIVVNNGDKELGRRDRLEDNLECILIFLLMLVVGLGSSLIVKAVEDCPDLLKGPDRGRA